MPKYNYVALDQKGNETKGSIEVGSQNEAIGRVKEMGLFPTKITESEKEDKGAAKKGKAKAAPKARTGGKKGMNLNIKIPGLGGGVKPKVLTTFTRQLATLVDAGRVERLESGLPEQTWVIEEDQWQVGLMLGRFVREIVTAKPEHGHRGEQFT